MTAKRNKNMLFITLAVLFINVSVHILHRGLGAFNHVLALGNHDHYSNDFVLNIILFIPILLYGVAVVLYRKNTDHPLIPLFFQLSLTFSSISIIAGGNGFVEYHFSIFMVVAIIAFFDDVKQIVISTVLFSVQHLGGYFFYPVLLCGMDDYPFSLLLIHVVFLLCTSGFTIFNIISKNRYTTELNQQNKEKEELLNQVISNLENASEEVIQTVDSLKESAKESANSSQHILTSIQQTASTAEMQTKEVENGKVMLEEMMVGFQQIAQSFSHVTESSNDTSNQAVQGYEQLQKALDQMEEISKSVFAVSTVIKQLEKRSTEINEILSVITGISDQTNMLALNAAIEAARAGEAGKGFAVVAEEVRKLAAASSHSAKKISVLIQEIQHDTEEAVDGIEKGSTSVKVGLPLFEKSGDAFKHIVEATKRVEDQITDVSAVTEQLAAGSDQVIQTMEEIKNASQQTSHAGEAIVKVAEEQFSQNEMLKSMTEGLEKLALDLNLLVQQVKK